MTRADYIHRARVYLAEARRRRRQDFWHTLMQWAANARCRAAEIKPLPVQSELAI